jgi:predicted small metal-binding protein
MAKSIRCECGFVARGESDERVIGVIRDHMATDHPALLNTVSREDLLGWIQVELPHLVRKALISTSSARPFDANPNKGDAHPIRDDSRMPRQWRRCLQVADQAACRAGSNALIQAVTEPPRQIPQRLH